MPTIRLKPNSAEFDMGNETMANKVSCHMPNCVEEAEFRAPADRSLSEHYNFCKKHITEYNKAWNFFDGMNPAEVEEHVVNAFHGDRPTWKHREFASMEEELLNRIRNGYGEDYESKSKAKDKRDMNGFEKHSPELEALNIMGLQPPITLEEIKREYKILAKRHHPDHNRNDPESEELLKCINMAYTVLKVAYGKYETLVAKDHK